MLEKVLAIARTVLHLAHHTYQVGVESVDTEVYGSALASLYDFLLNLLAHLAHHLLDACRMDAAVSHELMQSQTGYLAAYRVKAREDYGFGGVVHYDFNAGGGFQSAYVAAFAAYDCGP